VGKEVRGKEMQRAMERETDRQTDTHRERERERERERDRERERERERKRECVCKRAHGACVSQSLLMELLQAYVSWMSRHCSWHVQHNLSL